MAEKTYTARPTFESKRLGALDRGAGYITQEFWRATAEGQCEATGDASCGQRSIEPGEVFVWYKGDTFPEGWAAPRVALCEQCAGKHGVSIDFGHPGFYR